MKSYETQILEELLSLEASLAIYAPGIGSAGEYRKSPKAFNNNG